MNKAVTQGMVASHLGVSQSLVALALRGDPRVAAATREKIEAAARELGYSAGTNQAARRLIARRFGTRVKSGVVSVLLSDFEGAPLGDLPYFAPLIKGMEAEAAVRGIELALHPWRKEVPRLMRDGLVDGVIDFGRDAERERWLCAHQMPAVSLAGAFLRPRGQEMERIPGLEPDHERGMRLVTGHLLSLGHRRVAYVGHAPDFPAAQGRLAGYRAALAEQKVRASKGLVEATVRNPTVEDGYAAAERLLRRKERFSAVVCYNDNLAMGVAGCLQQAGLAVPGAVSVTGFDDVSTEYGFAPGITSVRFDRFELGRRAVDVLCALVEGGEPGCGEAVGVELVVRGSTGRGPKA